MASLETEMDAEKVMKHVTMKVIIKEGWRFKTRKAIAVLLVRLASFVLGCGGVEIMERD